MRLALGKSEDDCVSRAEVIRRRQGRGKEDVESIGLGED